MSLSLSHTLCSFHSFHFSSHLWLVRVVHVLFCIFLLLFVSFSFSFQCIRLFEQIFNCALVCTHRNFKTICIHYIKCSALFNEALSQLIIINNYKFITDECESVWKLKDLLLILSYYTLSARITPFRFVDYERFQKFCVFFFCDFHLSGA